MHPLYDSDGTVGLYRVEVSLSEGTGKLEHAGGLAGAMKESVQRAFSFLQTRKGDLGIARDVMRGGAPGVYRLEAGEAAAIRRP